jgi:inner membrane protease subunit 2
MASFAAHFSKTLMVVVPVTIMFNDLVASFAFVKGPSMQPTLNPSGSRTEDIVLLDRMSANLKSLRRGDVVVLDSPTHRNKHIVKRLVGMPGDWVKTRDNDLIHVPTGKVWIEGDNKDNSATYGPLPVTMIKAKVSRVVWPLSRWGPVDERKDKESRLFIAHDENKRDFPRRSNNEGFWG